MKAIIKRATTVLGNTCFKVFSQDEPVLSKGIFWYKGEESEKEARSEALALAKNIENDIATEEIVYETPEN